MAFVLDQDLFSCEMSSRGLLIILCNHVHDLKYMDLVSPNWPNASNTLKQVWFSLQMSFELG